MGIERGTGGSLPVAEIDREIDIGWEMYCVDNDTTTVALLNQSLVNQKTKVACIQDGKEGVVGDKEGRGSRR